MSEKITVLYAISEKEAEAIIGQLFPESRSVTSSASGKKPDTPPKKERQNKRVSKQESSPIPEQISPYRAEPEIAPVQVPVRELTNGEIYNNMIREVSLTDPNAVYDAIRWFNGIEDPIARRYSAAMSLFTRSNIRKAARFTGAKFSKNRRYMLILITFIAGFLTLIAAVMYSTHDSRSTFLYALGAALLILMAVLWLRLLIILSRKKLWNRMTLDGTVIHPALIPRGVKAVENETDIVTLREKERMYAGMLKTADFSMPLKRQELAAFFSSQNDPVAARYAKAAELYTQKNINTMRQYTRTRFRFKGIPHYIGGLLLTVLIAFDACLPLVYFAVSENVELPAAVKILLLPIAAALLFLMPIISSFKKRKWKKMTVDSTAINPVLLYKNAKIREKPLISERI